MVTSDCRQGVLPRTTCLCNLHKLIKSLKAKTAENVIPPTTLLFLCLKCKLKFN